MFPHKIDVYRSSSTISAGAETLNTDNLVHSQISCLIEGMGAARQATILGTWSGYKYHLTWGSEEIREEDLIVFSGKNYLFRRGTDDRLRPIGETNMPAYQTGFIEEDILGTRL